jgi:hypothetical protein
LLIGVSLEAAGNEARAADLYERYLRDFNTVGGWDGFVVAHARLGVLRMRESCPIRGYLDACVEVVKVRMECPEFNHDDRWAQGPRKPVFFWGESAKRLPRDPGKLSAAKRHLRMALDKTSLKKAERDAASSPARSRRLANSRADAVVFSVSEIWDAYRALGETPWDLDFTPPTEFDDPCEARRKKARFERSSRVFMQWLTDTQAGFEQLRAQYRKAVLVGAPEASLAASGRFAVVTSRVVDALAGGGMMSLECGRFSGTDKFEPLENNAVSAADHCARMANAWAIDDGWAAHCFWELQRFKPSEYPKLVELSPSPAYMRHARDDSEFQPVVIEKADLPPKRLSRPAKRRCLERGEPGKGAAPLGVLKMQEGSHLAPIFGRDTETKDRLVYPDGFLSKLAERFPPPWTHTIDFKGNGVR